MNDTDVYWSECYEQGTDFKQITSEELHKILSYLGDEATRTALDIGCGTGQLTRELYHFGFEGMGIDASAEAISRAKQNTTRDINYIQLNVDNEALSGGTFSLITCKLVYTFIKDKPKFLSSVKEVLAENGIFVINTPTKEQSPDKPRIAVDHETTLQELSEFFTVEFYDLNNLRTYICRKVLN